MPEQIVSVVICTYNRADNLRQALATVNNQMTEGFAYEIVVVDDESTDHTPQVVAETGTGTAEAVRYVLQKERLGLASTRNRGVHEARGDWVVFFDDDQLAAPDWLKNLLDVARSHEALCVGGSRRLDLPETVLAVLGPVCRSMLGENIYQEPPAVLAGKELPTTGNLMISRRVFEKVGDFDLRFSGSEDTEFLQRVRRAGFDIWTAPRAMCAHMIPEYRTKPAYFRWASLRWGLGFAKIDCKQHGTWWMLGLCAARVLQAAGIHLPHCVLARLRGNSAAAMDRRTLLWRAEGYVRATLWLTFPRLFRQHRFIDSLAFRAEREMFAGK